MTLSNARDSVLITTDLTRAVTDDANATDGNVRWLEGCLRPAFLQLGLTSKTVFAADFDAAGFLASLGLPPNGEGWARAYSQRSLSNTAEELLDAVLDTPTFAIGFGLPIWMMARLHARAVPFLDLEIHPLRFGRDLFLRVRTNHAEIATCLRQIAHNEGELSVDAGLRLGNHALFSPARYGTRDVITLFAGQSGVDAALLGEGHIKTPSDYLEEIRHAARECDYLFIRPHPYVPALAQFAPVLEATPNAVLVDDPTYHLLMEPAIGTVVALSSSVTHEAACFGKAAQRLMTPDCATTLLSDLIVDEVRVGVDFFDPSFWRAALGRGPMDWPRSTTTPDQLRRSYARGWGLDGFQPRPAIHPIKASEVWSGATPDLLGPSLLYGWNTPEAAGVWSAAERAWICLRPAPGVRAVTLSVSDGIAAWRPGARFAFRVVSKEGPTEPEWLELSPIPQAVTLERNPATDLMIIECRCDKTLNPAADGFAPDGRTLGALLQVLQAH